MSCLAEDDASAACTGFAAQATRRGRRGRAGADAVRRGQGREQLREELVAHGWAGTSAAEQAELICLAKLLLTAALL